MSTEIFLGSIPLGRGSNSIVLYLISSIFFVCLEFWVIVLGGSFILINLLTYLLTNKFASKSLILSCRILMKPPLWQFIACVGSND